MIKIIFLATTLFASAISFAQYSVYGTIQDSLATPIVGATVKIAETFKGTTSNNNGFFKLSNLKQETYVLEISFIGYQTQQIVLENLTENKALNIILKENNQLLNELIVAATRVNENTSFAHTTLTKNDLERTNLGQDVPILLQNTPAMVVTSDAGGGIGYTGFRIRGSDATRINVTVNGIPLNDAESHSVFWVNMPDFASSTESIQIQRGVGSSTNGAGAFGGSVNLQTDANQLLPYAEVAGSYGSFNSHKQTLKFGTGLINKRWAFDGRLSNIQSDGYIDRSFSDLKSFYASGGYFGEKTMLKAVVFSGKEKTYQAWYGTPESRINNDVEAMNLHAINNGLTEQQTQNLLNSGRTYNFYEYENQTDNYQQDHYQLHFSHQITSKLAFSGAIHYTYGRGFFEEFREKDAFENYGLAPLVLTNDTITNSDIIRRRWLKNDFYGATYSLNYANKKVNFIIGGASNNYEGKHFGEIIWSEFANGSSIRDNYYNSTAQKLDINHFAKLSLNLTEKIALIADFQLRYVNYATKGTDNDLQQFLIDEDFLFFNPKAGINYKLNKHTQIYSSFSVGNREPVRSDFIDNVTNKQPTNETLYDYEAGINFKKNKFQLLTNFYFMDYRNQLILTGNLNDVGAPIRINVDKSYRVGVELVGNYMISKKLTLHGNATFSQNKINTFNEVLFDFTNGFDVIEIKHNNTDIALSPTVIAAFGLDYNIYKGLKLGLQTKYVGKQFLDNTSDSNRKIDAYSTLDGRLAYTFYPKKMKEISINLMVNNILNKKYSSNGYTFSYVFGDLITENFYYPQAGTSFLLGAAIKF